MTRKAVGNGMIDLDKKDCTVYVGRGMTREGMTHKAVGNGMIDMDKEDCTVGVGRGMTREGMTRRAVGNGMIDLGAGILDHHQYGNARQLRKTDSCLAKDNYVH